MNPDIPIIYAYVYFRLKNKLPTNYVCVKEIKEESWTEDRKKFLKEDYKLSAMRKVMGYVEWQDEDSIEIPEWCPLPDIK